MNTIKRYAIALGLIVSFAAGVVAALGLVAFLPLRVLGVDGVEWSDAGHALILLGCSVASLIALDNLEGKS